MSAAGKRFAGWMVYAAALAAPFHVYRTEVGPGNASLFRVLILLAAGGLGVRFLATHERPDRVMLRPYVIWLTVVAVFLAYEAAGVLPRSETALGQTFYQGHVFFFFAAAVVAWALMVDAAKPKTLVTVVLISAVPQLL